MAKLVNLRAAIRRQTTPGSLLLLVLAVILFGPRALDYITNEPWVTNSLTLVEATDGRMLVADTVTTHSTIFGVRSNTIEDKDGAVLCSQDHRNSWTGRRNRFWRLEAFGGCQVPPEAFRVCSQFTITSDSGRQRHFGPFCSDPTRRPTRLP